MVYQCALKVSGSSNPEESQIQSDPEAVDQNSLISL